MPEATELVEEAGEKVKDAAPGGGGDGLAKKLIGPAAAGLGTLAAGYVARKGPELVKGKVLPRLEGKGSDVAEKLGGSAAQGAKDKIASGGGLLGKLVGGGDDDGGSGGGDSGHADVRGYGKGRRLPIQESIDVAAPVAKVYEAWTDFEQLPEFMHRVESVDQQGGDKLVWHENIWGIRRDWTAKIVEQKQNQLVAWRSTSRGGNTGVVTFHKLSDRLTRVEVNMDFQPGGMLEKIASGLRFHRRAAKTDLKRFKAFVEMQENAHGTTAEGEEGEGDEQQSRASSNGSHGRSADDAGKQREERSKRREQRRKTAAK